MKTYLVSYATGRFVQEQNRLMESALQNGVSDPRAWNRERLQQTDFYKRHKAVLDMERGAGYWLWKPFIVSETLNEMGETDFLFYSDAGIEILRDVAPLKQLCRQRGGPILFAGYGRCREWTKRDCFLYMGLDIPRYHEGPMLDASFLVLTKTERSLAFVAEWLRYCSDHRILTDEPNVGGLPNLQGFMDHRHDQSVLSLLAAREQIELFRRPSQYGHQHTNTNSSYPTLLYHHRGALKLKLRQDIRLSPGGVFDQWVSVDGWNRLLRALGAIAVETEQYDLGPGGRYRFAISLANGACEWLSGAYLKIERPRVLVYTWQWSHERDAVPWETRVTVEFAEIGEDTEVTVRHDLLPNSRTRNEQFQMWTRWLAELARSAGANPFRQPF